MHNILKNDIVDGEEFTAEDAMDPVTKFPPRDNKIWNILKSKWNNIINGKTV